MKGVCSRRLFEPLSSAVSTSTVLEWPSADRRDVKFYAIRVVKEVFTGRRFTVKLAQ